MDQIDLLEKRIAALELKVLPQDKCVDISQSQTVTDLLLQTHTMIATALSCREVITFILQRMATLNSYLDPNYSWNQLQIEEKRRYILEVYPEFRKTVELVNDLVKLNFVLDSDPVRSIPALIEKLDSLTVSNVDTYQNCKEITGNILKALQQYEDIIASIKILFVQLEKSVSEIEISLQPKVSLDD